MSASGSGNSDGKAHNHDDLSILLAGPQANGAAQQQPDAVNTQSK